MGLKKTFIGFDLGDGESITDYVTLDIDSVSGAYQTHFNLMTMPGSTEPGRAIPTAFAYDDANRLVFAKSITIMPDMVHGVEVNFKRCPSDLLPGISDARKTELIGVFSKAVLWPEEVPELNTDAVKEFRDSVVTFTNAVFENEIYQNVVKSEAADSEEIVFCVGHPTKWNDLDVYMYKMILNSSILGKGTYAGKKSSLILAAESRAAYLTIKDKTTSAVLPKGTSALLIDVGSSTIDLTCVTADSHNYQFNSGNNYLGARGIDYLIRELYLDKLKEDDKVFDDYKNLVRRNPEFDKAVTLACRLAKEDMYSGGIGIGRVNLGDFAPIRIKQQEVDDIAGQKPLVPVLSQNIDLPDRQKLLMGSGNWISLFRDFLTEQKNEIHKQGIRIGRIIMTGSASKMPFVEKTVKKVFSELAEDGILADMNPSRSISMGLALVGPSNEKSVAYQKDLNNLIDNKLPSLIQADLPKLADDMAMVIDDIVCGMVENRLKEWRDGDFRTLDDMTTQIKMDCSEDNLKELLNNSSGYNDAIQNWLTDVVGQDIAVELKEICSRYGVKEITINDLNIFKVPDIDIGGVDIDVLDFMDAVIAIVAVIAGIITAIVLPFILGIIIALISWISVTIAALLLAILLAIPGIGWTILLGVAGIAVVRAAASGLGDARRQLTEKMQSIDLPQWVRNRMTDDKIRSELAKAGIKEKIKRGILEEKSKAGITEAVTLNLRGQIEKRAEDIKYVIESR